VSVAFFKLTRYFDRMTHSPPISLFASPSPNHCFIHLTQPLTFSLILSPTHNLNHPLTISLTYSSISQSSHSARHPPTSFTQSTSYLSTHLLQHAPTHPLIHPLTSLIQITMQIVVRCAGIVNTFCCIYLSTV
jgi:hypothetical protein